MYRNYNNFTSKLKNLEEIVIGVWFSIMTLQIIVQIRGSWNIRFE